MLVKAHHKHHRGGARASVEVQFEMEAGVSAEVLLEMLAEAQVEVLAGAQVGEGKVGVSVEAHYEAGIREVLAEAP